MRVLFALSESDDLLAYIRARRPDLDTRILPPEQVTAADLDWAEALVGFRRVSAPGWGRVRWIHSVGAGVDRLVYGAELPESILLTRSPEDFGPSMGEYCVARALAETQRLRTLADAQQRREWPPLEPEMLAGTRALIVGTGMVGQGIARAFAALGCVVDGLSRFGRPAEKFRTVRPFAEFGVAVQGARWLVLALPRTRDTHHLLNRARLAECGGAYLINVGRGAVVEEEALPDALDHGWISGAALDVFEQEPLPASSPLWSHLKVTISPHCSGPSTLKGMGDGFLECLAVVERGERPKWAVDPGVGY